MKDTYEQFLKTLENPTLRFAKKLTVLGESDLDNITPQILTKIIIDEKPATLRNIAQLCTVIGKYAKFLKREDIIKIVAELDKRAIWDSIRFDTKQKYISNDEFLKLINRVNLEEERNALLKITLLRSIYEGMYSAKFEVLINLRSQDINGNIATLTVDDESYDLEISSELAEDLIELGGRNTITRNNRFGDYEVPAVGKWFDSCFKFSFRCGNKDVSSIYYQTLIALRKRYLDFDLNPYDLFISGIMYRVALKMKEENIDIEKVFESHSNEDRGIQIVTDELNRCHYDISFAKFRMGVVGYLDIFKTS